MTQDFKSHRYASSLPWLFVTQQFVGLNVLLIPLFGQAVSQYLDKDNRSELALTA